MKTKTILLAVSLASVFFYAPCSRGQSNVVYYGANSNALSVAFADTNLSASVQASIVSDLRLCLQEWGKSSTLDLGAYEPGLAGYLYNPKTGPHYPKGFIFPDNLVASGEGGVVLRVPTGLSDAYTNAFAFAVANSNTVAAAYEFVTFVSSSNFASIPPENLPNYVLLKNSTPSEITADAQEIISELRHQTYYPPSILGFHHSGVGPSATNLWLYVPCSSPAGGGYVEWSPFPAIWHEGKWRFCVWQD